MREWLRHAVEADPTAPDEWLNRATAVALILVLGVALYSRTGRDPNGPSAAGEWRLPDFAHATAPEIHRPLPDP